MGGIMHAAPHRSAGFTLIEMMVTLTVIIILLLIAVPSFETFRQRNATRASADRILVLWNQARFEAAKRNSNVQFVVNTTANNYCVGFATTIQSDPASDTACDCSANACNIANFPGTGNQGEWNGVTLSAGSATPAPLAMVIIEPKHTFLTSASPVGAITVNGPTGRNAYKLYLEVDKLGRAVLCEPPNAVNKLSDYGTRICASN
jgi:type IV fimbrial biogenesis protein FimT